MTGPLPATQRGTVLAGVKAGRRPPAGLGLDAGEDGATVGSRKRAITPPARAGRPGCRG